MLGGFARVELDQIADIATGAGGVGLVALLKRYLDKKKYAAEIHKLNADADKVQAETDDLTSVRLIRELNVLSAILARQSIEIDELRRKVLQYAEREASHAIEVSALRLRVKELEGFRGPNPPVTAASPLVTLVPPIPHTPSEFDEGHD